MKRGKIVGLVLLVLAGCGIACYFNFCGGNGDGAPVRVSGHIEVTEVDVSFRLSGHVARLVVEEGDMVEKGDVLAELSRTVLTARRDEASARVEELDARVEARALAVVVREEILEADVKRAEAGVTAAGARYRSLATGSREGEIAEAAAARDRARTESENRAHDFERLKRLFEQHIISASRYDAARTDAEAARAAYEAALERFKLVKAGPRREEVLEGKAQLAGSDAALSAARAARREIDTLKLELKALRAQADQARAMLEVAEDDLAESLIHAPFDGFVTVKEVEEGEFVQVGTPVVTVARLERVWVKTYVPETRLGRVSLGQKAEVFSDSFPRKPYPGVVSYISPRSEFTPKNVQTTEERVKLVYRIKVTVDNPPWGIEGGNARRRGAREVTGMAIVEVQGLVRSFGRVEALTGLSFSVEEGEIFGFVGPDGAGKTTCLRILCGVMRPGAGSARVMGIDVGAEPEAVKPHIGYMAQPAGLYEDLTVRENIEFYADLYEVPRQRYATRLERLLSFSGLAPFTDRLFRNLSGGMKQKVGLSCALIHTPKVLFLDEPTNGVDPVSRRDFWNILYELRQEGVTIVAASTYLDEIDRCDRVALFHGGRADLVMEPLAMRSLMKGVLFNLSGVDRRLALGYLKTDPRVAHPSIFGNGIHFSLAAEEELEAVNAGLASAGVRGTVERIPPVLEDVYLSVLEGGPGGAAP